MNRVAAIAALLALTPIGVSAQDTYPVNPGYWEVTTDWLGLVVKTDRYCVEPRNISKFLAGPCNHIYHCDYPVQEVGDGKARFDGYIRGHNELYHVRGGGTYSPTSLDLSMSGSGHWRVVPIAGARFSLSGRYLGADCPVDAKRFK
jgi:hypothetical protein